MSKSLIYPVLTIISTYSSRPISLQFSAMSILVYTRTSVIPSSGRYHQFLGGYLPQQASRIPYKSSYPSGPRWFPPAFSSRLVESSPTRLCLHSKLQGGIEMSCPLDNQCRPELDLVNAVLVDLIQAITCLLLIRNQNQCKSLRAGGL